MKIFSKKYLIIVVLLAGLIVIPWLARAEDWTGPLELCDSDGICTTVTYVSSGEWELPNNPWEGEEGVPFAGVGLICPQAPVPQGSTVTFYAIGGKEGTYEWFLTYADNTYDEIVNGRGSAIARVRFDNPGIFGIFLRDAAPNMNACMVNVVGSASATAPAVVDFGISLGCPTATLDFGSTVYLQAQGAEEYRWTISKNSGATAELPISTPWLALTFNETGDAGDYSVNVYDRSDNAKHDFCPSFHVNPSMSGGLTYTPPSGDAASGTPATDAGAEEDAATPAEPRGSIAGALMSSGGGKTQERWGAFVREVGGSDNATDINALIQNILEQTSSQSPTNTGDRGGSIASSFNFTNPGEGGNTVAEDFSDTIRDIQEEAGNDKRTGFSSGMTDLSFHLNNSADSGGRWSEFIENLSPLALSFEGQPRLIVGSNPVQLVYDGPERVKWEQLSGPGELKENGLYKSSSDRSDIDAEIRVRVVEVVDADRPPRASEPLTLRYFPPFCQPTFSLWMKDGTPISMRNTAAPHSFVVVPGEAYRININGAFLPEAQLKSAGDEALSLDAGLDQFPEEKYALISIDPHAATGQAIHLNVQESAVSNSETTCWNEMRFEVAPGVTPIQRNSPGVIRM